MHVLALDIGSRCGWAHSAGYSGTWDLSVRRDESSGMRLVRLEGKLLELCRTLGVELIAFEASRQIRHGRAVAVLGEIQGLVKSFCHRYTSRCEAYDKPDGCGIEYLGRSPAEIKKHATGKGNADKAAVLAAARARWPQVASEDEADALWLLDLVSKELQGA